MGKVYIGVVDRFEGEHAVVLLESEGEIVDELVVSEEEIPADGRHEDAVLSVEREDGDIIEIAYKPEETTRRKERARDRFNSLSERPPSADDESN